MHYFLLRILIQIFFKIYNKPEDLITKFYFIANDKKVKENINKINLAGNEKIWALYYVFSQLHTNYDFKNDQIYRQILTNIK